MRAHRVKVRISDSHELRVQLPDDFPTGEAEVIVLGTSVADARGEQVRKHTVDELLAARLKPPPGVGPVTLREMEAAIAEGAAGRGGA